MTPRSSWEDCGHKRFGKSPFMASSPGVRIKAENAPALRLAVVNS